MIDTYLFLTRNIKIMPKSEYSYLWLIIILFGFLAYNNITFDMGFLGWPLAGGWSEHRQLMVRFGERNKIRILI